MLRLVDETQNDTAGLGSAVHEGIRYILDELMADGEPEYDDALAAAVKHWHEVWETPGFNIVEVPSKLEGAKLIESCLVRFWNEFLPAIWGEKILAVETMFNVIAYEDEVRTIYLAGMQDLWMALDIWDWKTSNKAYSGRDKWKYDRSYLSVQHIQYPWARLLLEGVPKEFIFTEDKEKRLPEFHYCVIPREPNGGSIPDVDKLTIAPTVGDAHFLLLEMLSYAKLVEARLDAWPLGPTDWWCSNKWCPNWDHCRGQYLKDDPWTLVERANAKLEKKRTRSKKTNA
jgi:hypothetical protein